MKILMGTRVNVFNFLTVNIFATQKCPTAQHEVACHFYVYLPKASIFSNRET